jgi:hypothetical protein
MRAWENTSVANSRAFALSPGIGGRGLGKGFGGQGKLARGAYFWFSRLAFEKYRETVRIVIPTVAAISARVLPLDPSSITVA